MGAAVAALLACLATAAPSQATLLADVERTDRALAASERSLRVAEDNRRRSEASLAAAQAGEAAARLRHGQLQAALGRRLGAVLRAGQGARWALLGGSADVGAFVDRQRLLEAIAAHDARLWRQVRESHAALRAAAQFAGETRDALVANERERRTQRDRLGRYRRQRSDKLRALRQDGAAHLVLRREQADAARDLRRAVGKAAPAASASAASAPFTGAKAGAPAADFAAQRGTLPRPAEGSIRRGFGQRVELTFGTATAHNGVDIAAPAGAQVQAVAPGRVVWADWLRGYGQVVIVAHGDGYHTVMAHLAETHVRPGQQVGQGQRVGLVGDTGSLRGTVLYFEVRRRGVPQDPMGWFAGSSSSSG